MMAVTDHKRHVKRVASLFELSDVALHCATTGHRWDDPPVVDVNGWGDVDTVEMRYTCECTRWRRDVLSAATGELLTRDYGGGEMPHVRDSRDAARAVAIARKREGKKAQLS